MGVELRKHKFDLQGSQVPGQRGGERERELFAEMKGAVLTYNLFFKDI